MCDPWPLPAKPSKTRHAGRRQPQKRRHRLPRPLRLAGMQLHCTPRRLTAQQIGGHERDVGTLLKGATHAYTVLPQIGLVRAASAVRTWASSLRSSRISRSSQLVPRSSPAYTISFIFTRSTMPSSASSAPIGSWMTSGFAPSISMIMSLQRRKLAPMRSILLTKMRRGTPYLSAWRHTVSDCGSTPDTESKTATAPSRTRRERSTCTAQLQCCIYDVASVVFIVLLLWHGNNLGVKLIHQPTISLEARVTVQV